MKLPLKTRILQYAIDRNDTFTTADVYSDLQKEYAGEKLFTRKTVDEYVSSFLGVNFLSAKQIEFDKDGQLLITYLITDYGKSRKKYIH